MSDRDKKEKLKDNTMAKSFFRQVKLLFGAVLLFFGTYLLLIGIGLLPESRMSITGWIDSDLKSGFSSVFVGFVISYIGYLMYKER